MDFYILAGLHLGLTALYFGASCRRKNKCQVLAETAVVLCLPFMGIVLLLSYRLLCWLLALHTGRQPEAEAEGQAFFRGVKLAEDIIPLNDAFLVDDVQKKRQYFTEAIKQAVVDNESILQMAVHDRDREIAYYAVAMLTARMEKLENEIFNHEAKVLNGESREDLPLLEEYAGLLKSYLAQEKFIDHVTYRKKQGDYIGLLDLLRSMRPDQASYYIEEIQQLISTENYAAAELICAELQEHFPQQEESFMMYIRLYQSWRKPQKLQQKIKELKACPIELSQEALTAIRFWDKEAVSHG